MAESSSIKQGLKDSTDEKEIDELSFSNSWSDKDSKSEYPADTRVSISNQLYSNEEEDNVENSDLPGATASPFQHAKNDSDENSDKNSDIDSKLSSATQAVQSRTAQQNRTNVHDKELITNAHDQPPNVGSEAGECASSRPPVDVGKTGPSHLAERILSEKDDQNGSQYLRLSRPVGTASTVGFLSNAAPNPAFDEPPVLQDLSGGARPKQQREEHSHREKPKNGRRPNGFRALSRDPLAENRHGKMKHQRKKRRRKPSKDYGPELSDAEGGADGLSALSRDPPVENSHGTMMHQSHGRESDYQQSSESQSPANVSAIITNTPATVAETVTVHADVTDASDSASATSGEFSGDCNNPHQVMPYECLSSATSLPSLSPPATSPRTADVAGKALLPSSPPSLPPSPPAPATSPAVQSITSPPVSTPWTMPPTTMTITATHLMCPTTATTKATVTATTTTTTTASSTSTAATRVLDRLMGLRLSPHILVRADAPRSRSPVPRRFQSDQLGHHIRLLRPTLGQEVYSRVADAYDVVSLRPNAAGFPAAGTAQLRIILGASNFQCRTNTGNGNRQQGMTEGQRQTIRTPSQELWHEVLQICASLPRRIHGQLCEACRRRLAVLLVFNCHHPLCETCSLRGPVNCLACGEFINGLSPFL